MLTTSLQTLHTLNTRGCEKGSRLFPGCRNFFRRWGSGMFGEEEKRMEPARGLGKKIEVTNKC